MASVFRVCIGKNSYSGLLNRLCKVSTSGNVMQVACISGKVNRIRRERPPPFPYKEKDYSVHQYFEPTIERYDENSKIVVVEGPIAAGKDKFARELAKELEMAYMPIPSFDTLYKSLYGTDLRSYDSEVEENFQTCDLQRFLTNPKHLNVPAFQFNFYLLKLHAYLESLLHLYSTGEGVVMNRCVYSDFVFLKAMYNAGYLSRLTKKTYNELLDASLHYLKKPHLVIYLDVPVNVVKEGIQKRGIPYEVNSKVLTTKYLTDIETAYKEEYLPSISDHAFLLMYDCTDGWDVTDVVEDIERINFVYDSNNPTKLQDWVFTNLSELEQARLTVSRKSRDIILADCVIYNDDNSELYYVGDDVKKIQKMRESRVEDSYAQGFIPSLGDNVWWKIRNYKTSWFPEVIPSAEL